MNVSSVGTAAPTQPAPTQPVSNARAADGDYKTKGVGHEVKDADGDYKPTKPATPMAASSSAAGLNALIGLQKGGA